MCGESRRLTPTTTAASQAPEASESIAASSATSDELHAVSIAIEGPLSPSTYEMRPSVTPRHVELQAQAHGGSRGLHGLEGHLGRHGRGVRLGPGQQRRR
jgi:hypothetical protein